MSTSRERFEAFHLESRYPGLAVNLALDDYGDFSDDCTYECWLTWQARDAEVSAQSALIADLKDIITIKDDCIDTLNAHVAKRDALIRNLRNVLKQQRIWQPYGSWSTLTDAEIDALLAKVEQSNGT